MLSCCVCELFGCMKFYGYGFFHMTSLWAKIVSNKNPVKKNKWILSVLLGSAMTVATVGRGVCLC